tara:strand:- start:818 stop:1477 length:660 start_codon:yes stop_codon:yes gene_type:complete
MRKRFFIAVVLLILFSTYKVQNNFGIKLKPEIKEILVENNFIVSDEKIKKKLSFLYNENLFLLSTKDIKIKLENIELIESFEIKKIYPNKIKIKIFERVPVAILQNKKEKKYFTENGNVINFEFFREFENLPIVFGDKQNFKLLYDNLKKTNFKLKTIKTFYLFETKRWDLLTKEDKLIKLPIKNYEKSLSNFLNLKKQDNFDKYKTFDYRINNQLILK